MSNGVPPQNLEAERSVLGAMLVSESAVSPVIDEAKLRVDDFYLDRHRALYSCLLEQHRQAKPTDEISVIEALRERGELEAAGDRHYVSELAATVAAVGNAAHHARIVQDHAQERRKQAIGADLRNGLPPAVAIEQLRALVASGGEQRHRLRVLDVGSMVDTSPPAVPWVIEGMAVRGSLAMVSGREGEGKSLLAMSLAAGVALGEEVAGLSCVPGGVLIVDAENGQYEIHRRVRTLGLPASGVTVIEADGFHLGQHLGEIEEQIERTNPSLLILDSFRSLWPGGDENDSAEVAAVLDPLRNLLRRKRVAGLLLHHISRAGNDYRGSSAIGAAIELGFMLSRNPEDPEKRDRRLLHCFKCRPAPEPDDRWLRLHLERGQVFVDVSEPYEGEEEKPAAPAQAELAPKMLGAAAEPIEWPDLARAIGRGPKDGTARRLRDELLKRGELERLEDGRLRGCQGATPLGATALGTPAEEAP